MRIFYLEALISLLSVVPVDEIFYAIDTTADFSQCARSKLSTFLNIGNSPTGSSARFLFGIVNTKYGYFLPAAFHPARPQTFVLLAGSRRSSLPSPRAAAWPGPGSSARASPLSAVPPRANRRLGTSVNRRPVTGLGQGGRCTLRLRMHASAFDPANAPFRRRQD
jgi:hypothetical protein